MPVPGQNNPEALEMGCLCYLRKQTSISYPCRWFDWVHALARTERLEGDDGVSVLNAGNDLHLLVDEMADIGVVVDVELYQQVVIARGGIYLGGDLGLGKRVGDGIGLA